MERGEVWWVDLPGRRPVGGVDVRAVGVEVEVGTCEGLPHPGVVRVAVPRDDQIFCTWLVTLPRGAFIERAWTLSSVQLRHVEDALWLAGPSSAAMSGHTESPNAPPHSLI